MDLIRIDTDAEKLVRKIRRLPKAMQTGIRDAIVRGLLVIEDRVRANTDLKWRHGASGLSGRLTSYARLIGELGLDAAIGFRKTRGFPYEMAQEYGAKAKPGKAIAIPVSGEAKRSEGPRSMQDMVLIKKHDRAVLARKSGRGGTGKLHIHWVLVKSIPARLRFRENVIASVPTLSREIVEGAVIGMYHA